MGDRDEEEELQMALRMSLHGSPPAQPDPKRSKPPSLPAGGESPEAAARRKQRDLMAAAAEKRLRSLPSPQPAAAVSPPPPPPTPEAAKVEPEPAAVPMEDVKEAEMAVEVEVQGDELPPDVAEKLWVMVFGIGVSKAVLAQWTNQGIRFSSDAETTMGLVQHEGGPCGVLATVQAYVLKYLLFFSDNLGNPEVSDPSYASGQRRFYQSSFAARDDFSSLTEDGKTRALVHAMVEILFLCGAGKKAAVALIGGVNRGVSGHDNTKEIDAALEGLSVESAMDIQKVLRISTFTSRKDAFHLLLANIRLFESRLGAMLFLISSLLSRGLECIQADRDDPSQPLVTAPFGHASQEIVNLLLCGEAVPNVFDGKMDLGGGMSLKGIPNNVEVGFLTLLESLNLCKVGQYLKCPKWPIWVVGSESHYTVLFALNPNVQEENELEERESKIRRAFDAQDQSGGGGFISVEGFQQVLRDTDINFPSDKLEDLCNPGIIVWSEFWQALLQLDKRSGGMKDPTGLMGKKQFTIYHFNGIAKSVLNGNANIGGSTPIQRPRICKLNVSVPPRWTQDEYLADVVSSSTSGSKDDSVLSLAPPFQTCQHAPLVDCIRTRWPRAVCSWVGDVPSIV
ncbi:ubiquitin carboxyl-terminal hydrolase MINDY-3 isoform X1 [Lolium rigidum]|uniref:ubiquitin carboxyl-terminal hydrolase MINDY-3 isoform X1 n=1 Tax=Lolium rigidum TaxID=89674 RepID=UPI001F5C7970|nr:ubiquitin carboxyl-terminal hydrolase MINDY-3 isoform X1 [Lolium rigidum]